MESREEASALAGRLVEELREAFEQQGQRWARLVSARRPRRGVGTAGAARKRAKAKDCWANVAQETIEEAFEACRQDVARQDAKSLPHEL